MEALEAKDLRIAFAKTPTVEFLKEAAGENELAARRLIYSNAFCEPDEGSAKQYAAELARRAMQEEGTRWRCHYKRIYRKKEGRVETFLLIAVAEESGAQVRQLYAQPDEHPGLLIGDGVQALYELVEQVVKKGSDKLEARPAHWKAFAAVLSVLLSLSILLCIGTGVLLRFSGEPLLPAGFSFIGSCTGRPTGDTAIRSGECAGFFRYRPANNRCGNAGGFFHGRAVADRICS